MQRNSKLAADYTCRLQSDSSLVGQLVTDLALREEELDAFPRLLVSDGVVFSFLIVTHGVQTTRWRGWTVWWCRYVVSCSSAAGRHRRVADRGGSGVRTTLEVKML